MPASNEEFIKKAFESGLTEKQVRAAVAERNQLNASKSKSNQWQPAAQEGAEKGSMGGFFQRASSGITSRFKPGAVNAQNTEVATVRGLVEAANRQTDPALKQKYLDMAKEAQAVSQGNISGRREQLLGNVGWSNDEANKYLTDKGAYAGSIAKDSIQGALDVGSVIAPSSQVFGTGSKLARIGNAGVTGLTAGTMSGAGRATQADSLKEGATDIATGAGLGFGMGVATQTGIEGVKALLNSRTTRAASESVSNMRDSTSAFLGGNKERAVSEMFGMNKSKSIVKNYRIEKGKKLQTEALKYAQEVFGKTDDDVLANLDKSKTATGKAIEASTKNLPEVDINKFDDEVKKMADEARRIGKPEQADEMLSYWEKIKQGNLRNPATGKFRTKGKITAYESWKLKTAFDENLWTEAGKSKNVTQLSHAEAQVREKAANFFRRNLRADKVTQELFDKYETLSAMEGSMFNKLGEAPGMPRLRLFNVSQITDAMMSGNRNQSNLQAILSKPGVKEQISKDPALMAKLLEFLKSGGNQLTKQRSGFPNVQPNIYGAVSSGLTGQSAMERASSQP